MWCALLFVVTSVLRFALLHYHQRFGQLNTNSVLNKFDMLTELVKSFVDVFVITETKLHDNFSGRSILIDDYHALFRYDWNGNSDGILLYIREDIPEKLFIVTF